MANKNLSDVLFEQKYKREKFVKLFVELVSIGEKLIRLLKEYQNDFVEPKEAQGKLLIEKWQHILQKIVFLTFEKRGSKKNK